MIFFIGIVWYCNAYHGILVLSDSSQTRFSNNIANNKNGQNIVMIEYKGKCSCETVTFKLIGEPLFTQHCHCNKCREITELSTITTNKVGYSFTAAYPTSKLVITSGKDQLKKITRNTSDLFLCKHCQNLIYGISQDPARQRGIGVNANSIQFPEGVLPKAFIPDKHVWYKDRVKNVNDDLPKYKDAPVEQFGSGELIK